MTLYDTEHAFIVISSAFGTEIYNNSCRGMWLHSSNSLTETEHIALICIELESGGQITVVDNIQNSVCFCVNLDLTKV